MEIDELDQPQDFWADLEEPRKPRSRKWWITAGVATAALVLLIVVFVIVAIVTDEDSPKGTLSACSIMKTVEAKSLLEPSRFLTDEGDLSKSTSSDCWMFSTAPDGRNGTLLLTMALDGNPVDPANDDRTADTPLIIDGASDAVWFTAKGEEHGIQQRGESQRIVVQFVRNGYGVSFAYEPFDNNPAIHLSAATNMAQSISDEITSPPPPLPPSAG